jgi:4a-hydroxytetrahydrobiopterin dehydratase
MPSLLHPHPELTSAMSELSNMHCQPRHGDHDRLPQSEVHRLLPELAHWTLSSDGHAISRVYRFKDFVAAVAFVNALTPIIETENHHPDLELSYGRCGVRFNTHDVNGLSLNDFICAAKTDCLFEGLTLAGTTGSA